MRTKSIPAAVFAMFLLATLSCEDGVGPPFQSGQDDPGRIIELTPRENEEAELAALWLSDALVAPQSLYEKLRDGLELLRRTWRDSIAEVTIGFVFPAEPGATLVTLTDSAVIQFRNGTYTEWDSLNQLFRLKSFDTSRYFDRFHWGTLRFEGRLHPESLAVYYGALDGIAAAHTNGLIGDWPCLYPWLIDGRLTFLIRKAWGDCPAGCIHSHFWYFKDTPQGVVFIGEWDAMTSPPPWWSEAEVAFRKYRGH